MVTNIANDIERLKEITAQIKALTVESDKIIKKIQQSGYVDNRASSYPLYASKISAARAVLQEHGHPLHLRELTRKVLETGFPAVVERTLAAMLRKYAKEGRTFKILGGNRWTLLKDV